MTGIIPNDQPLPKIEEVEINVEFKYRAIVEMVNHTKNKDLISTRLNSVFNVEGQNIYNAGIKRPGGYAAKAMCTGTFDLNTILRMGCGLNIFGIVKDNISWNVKDVNNKDKVVIREQSNFLQILYSTATLTADVSIIPVFKDTVTEEYFEANKEEIYKIFDAEIEELSNFVFLVKSCRFSNKGYKNFMSILAQIIDEYDVGNKSSIDYYNLSTNEVTLINKYLELIKI